MLQEQKGYFVCCQLTQEASFGFRGTETVQMEHFPGILFIYKTRMKPKGKPSEPREYHKDTSKLREYSTYPDEFPRQINRLKIVPIRTVSVPWKPKVASRVNFGR